MSITIANHAASAAWASPPSTVTPAAVVAIGLAGLAVAMGIGRFSFTPLLPLMQRDAGVSLAQGSWLATANYVGYLAGALVCIVSAPAPTRIIQWGLAAIALVTAAMGVTHHLWQWIALRFLAGAASAYVLVGVSAWAMPILARGEKAAWSGRLFSGVGVGILIAGMVGLAAGLLAWRSQATWIVLGAMAAVVTAVIWRLVDDGRPAVAAAAPTRAPLGRQAWIGAASYGCFGYGYIIPATFLPALARDVIADPAVFGWVWPVFGAAGALSTVIAAGLMPALSPRRVWVYAKCILAVGVLAPVVATTLPVLLFAAVCVGGTFMVITMAGIEEARRLGGAQAPRLMAIYTAAFAAGQIAGPLTVGAFGGGLVVPGLMAAAALAASCVALSLPHRSGSAT
jgi:predicted MFS family arabinose efflux permease